MIMLKDSSLAEIMTFLGEAEKHGKNIPTSFAGANSEARTIATEARMLKRMFIKLRD